MSLKMHIMTLNLLAFLLFMELASAGDNWAFLVAGSRYYFNYRHQADVAHANYLLQRTGVDMDKIVVMSYDDVARDEENTEYNNLINMPEGSNKYKDIRVDFSRDDVTNATFFAVLDGDKEYLRERGSGRFLDVKPDDTVFIYMTDHGANQLFGMPSEIIDAKDLVGGLRRLKARCKAVLIFVEACESGSLFQHYLTRRDYGILAVSASNATESSYATYWDRSRSAYLGDEFSTAFLEALDRSVKDSQSIRDLIQITKLETIRSHVQVFGDKSILSNKVSAFIPASPIDFGKRKLGSKPRGNENSGVKAREVQLLTALEVIKKRPWDENSKFVIQNDPIVRNVFQSFKNSMSLKGIDVDQFPLGYKSDEAARCYREAREHIFKLSETFKKIDSTFTFLRYLNSACFQGVEVADITSMFDKALLMNLV